MQISCPSCKARYLVKPEAITAKGRTVKCAKCHNKWFVKGVDQPIHNTTHVNEETSFQIPKGSTLPALAADKKLPKEFKIGLSSAFVAVMLIFCVANANMLMQKLPFLKPAYRAFGIYDNSNIKLDNVSYQIKKNDNTLVITGRIVNKSKEVKKIPKLRISVFDNNNAKVNSMVLKANGETLNAGEGANFQNDIKLKSFDVSKLVLDIGDSVELMLR